MIWVPGYRHVTGRIIGEPCLQKLKNFSGLLCTRRNFILFQNRSELHCCAAWTTVQSGRRLDRPGVPLQELKRFIELGRDCEGRKTFLKCGKLTFESWEENRVDCLVEILPSGQRVEVGTRFLKWIHGS